MRNWAIAYLLLGIGGLAFVAYIIFMISKSRSQDKERKRILYLYNVWGLILLVVYGFGNNVLVNPIYYDSMLHFRFTDADTISFLVIWGWRATVYYLAFSILVWSLLGSRRVRENPKLVYRYFFMFSIFMSTAWTTDFEKFIFVNHGIDIYFFLHWVGGICACFMFYLFELVYLEKPIMKYLGVHGNHFSIRNKMLIIDIGLTVMLLASMFAIIIGGLGKDSQNLMLIKITICAVTFLLPLVLIIVKNSKNIAGNVEKTVEFLGYAAKQDFSRYAAIVSFDEFSELKDSLETLKTTFGEVIGAAKSTASDVSSSAEQISSSLRELSVQIEQYYSELSSFTDSQIQTANNAGISIENTSEKFASVLDTIGRQSEVVQENSRIIEKITGDIRGISDKTRDASRTSDTLFQAAEDGGKLIDETLHSIEEIETSSQRISEISGIINTIAEETALLAMNAAIEASHAGEAGKGFAIVAEEMRKLAENSAANTASITSLIEEILSRVEHSLRMMKASREGFMDIRREVGNTRAVNLEVAEGMESQASSLNQVLATTSRLEEITAKIRETSEHFQESNRVMKITFSEIGSLASNEKTATDRSSQAMKASVGTMKSVIENNLLVVSKLNEIIAVFKLTESARNGSSSVHPV